MAIPDLNSYYQTPEIQQLTTNANTAAGTAGTYAAAAPLLEQKLKQALQEKLDYNKDIIDQQSKAQADYFAAPAQARAQYQDITNPFDREALVAKAVANAYSPYAALSSILQNRQGSVSDIINSGVGAFNSAATAEQNDATQAQNALQQALQMAGIYAGNAQWQYEVTHPSGGGVGSAAYNQAQEKAAQQDASKGMGLRDLIQKYTGQLDPDTLYQIYSQYNYGTNSAPGGSFQAGKGGYGAAKEDTSALQALGITSAELPKAAAGNWKTTTQGGLKIGGNQIGGTQYLVNSKTGAQLKMNNGEVWLQNPKDGTVKAYQPGDPEIDQDLNAGWIPYNQ